MHISKITAWRAETLAHLEGITPSKALEALCCMGWNQYLAGRVARAHSSPELEAELAKLREQHPDPIKPVEAAKV